MVGPSHVAAVACHQTALQLRHAALRLVALLPQAGRFCRRLAAHALHFSGLPGAPALHLSHVEHVPAAGGCPRKRRLLRQLSLQSLGTLAPAGGC